MSCYYVIMLLCPGKRVLLVKHLRFVLKAMFDRLVTSRALLGKQSSLRNDLKDLKNILCLRPAKKYWTRNDLQRGQTVKYCV